MLHAGNHRACVEVRLPGNAAALDALLLALCHLSKDAVHRRDLTGGSLQNERWTRPRLRLANIAPEVTAIRKAAWDRDALHHVAIESRAIRHGFKANHRPTRRQAHRRAPQTKKVPRVARTFEEQMKVGRMPRRTRKLEFPDPKASPLLQMADHLAQVRLRSLPIGRSASARVAQGQEPGVSRSVPQLMTKPAPRLRAQAYWRTVEARGRRSGAFDDPSLQDDVPLVDEESRAVLLVKNRNYLITSIRVVPGHALSSSSESRKR